MKEMTFTEHLEELRRPLRAVLENTNSGDIVYLGLLDKVMSQLQVAFWTSIIVSSPLWFLEVWKFIKPGLYSYEVKAVRPFLFIGFIFFCLGVSFGYFLVFPLTFETIMGFGVENVRATISLKDYLILASKVLVFLGIVFQLPNVLLILGFMGIVTKYSLRSMRRYIYVAFAVLSALLTPPDPYTLLALWFPLILLFEVGIVAVALIVHPYLARQHSGETNHEDDA